MGIIRSRQAKSIPTCTRQLVEHFSCISLLSHIRWPNLLHPGPLSLLSRYLYSCRTREGRSTTVMVSQQLIVTA